MRRVFRLHTLLLLLAFVGRNVAYAKSGQYVLFVGTYTNTDGKDTGSKGIYSYRFDEASGKVSALGVAAETTNPSFLTVAPENKFLYAVNELREYKGAASGGVTAFAVDHKTGKLTRLDEVASRGSDPCYIAFDKSGKFVLVANYTGGNAAVFPVSSDGHIAEASSVIKDEGQLGPNKERQDTPHAHWIETSSRNRFAYVADLGLDRVLVYKFDAAKGTLGSGEAQAAGGPSNPKDLLSATLAPGTGPRHIAVSANGKFMYVLGELDSTVTVFANNGNETFRSVQKISALPAGFSRKNDAAEIAIHPSGKFLYTSNRGDDSIAVFAIDHSTGRLTSIQHISSGGKVPRNFAIDPEGNRLLAANEETGNIVEFSIDRTTGQLKSVGEVAKTPAPVCLVFVPTE